MKKNIWLIILCIVAFFVNNGVLKTDIMESRNIVTAREMVYDGNWLIPTMNGGLRLEKPPLPTWVAGCIESIFPDSITAQRAAAGMMGIIWAFFLYLLAMKIIHRKEYAYISTLVFLTCYNVVLMGRTASWDIYCHAFMMGAIYFLWRAFYETSHYWRHYMAAGIMLGLSFLSKGPVSFYALLLPFLIAAILYKRPPMKGRWKAFSFMLLICILISSWWYIYIIVFHADMASAVIHKESSSWINHNVRPWYYYWRFFAEMGVWGLLTLAAIFIPYWKRVLPTKREYLFTIGWVLFSLILLSLMPEKKMRYLLPMAAPCALAVGMLLHYFSETKEVDTFSRILYYVNGGFIAVVTLASPVLLYLFGYNKGTLSLTVTIIASILLLGIAYWLIKATILFHPIRFLNGVAALFLMGECLLMNLISTTFTNPTFNSIEKTRYMDNLKGIPFYHNQDEELRIELVYAAYRKIAPLNLNDSVAVMKALPCVVITRNEIEKELNPSILTHIIAEKVGTFDDNRHPPKDRHYNPLFLNQVTLLKEQK